MSGDRETAWPQVWKINGACLRASAAGGLAWLFWQAGKMPGWELFAFFAAIFAIAAVKQGVIALVGIVRLALRARKWATYRRQGAAPKADSTALEADLRRRGLIK